MAASTTINLKCDVVGCVAAASTDQPYAIAVEGWSELVSMQGQGEDRAIVSLLLCPTHTPQIGS